MDGFDQERLRRVTAWVDKQVSTGRVPGMAISVYRNGQECLAAARGLANEETKTPMSTDTIWRIYSMTKPIASVALLILYERGLFQLDDPVAKYAPFFADMQVAVGGSVQEGNLELKPAENPITIKHLLTHTSGLTYGFLPDDRGVHTLYAKEKVCLVPSVEGELDTDGEKNSLELHCRRIAKVPLLFEPGTKWNYSYGIDVAGYLVEVLSGKSFGDFLRAEIFGPLKMPDTDFFVPESKRDRFAACYTFAEPEAAGAPAYKLMGDNSSYYNDPEAPSGGGGLVGTLHDYQRFCQMILNKGSLDGVRILGRKTVEYVSLNHLPGGRDLPGMGQPDLLNANAHGMGHGLIGAVMINPAATSHLCSTGEIEWCGLASTLFWIDPAENVSVVLATQLVPVMTYNLRRELRTAVYQALV